MGGVIRFEMNSELAASIDLFRRDQERALEYIHGHLEVPVPKTTTDWVYHGLQQIRSRKSIWESDHVTFYVHGYGVEITHPQFHIDFDYGPTGECDCFDLWRLSLHRHFRLRLPNPVNDERPIDEWIQAAIQCGDLIRVAETYHMLYNPHDRSQWNHPLQIADNKPMHPSGGSGDS
jgi:hypothetical protein